MVIPENVAEYKIGIPRSYIQTAAKSDWQTPVKLFDELDKEFGPFDCDPACDGSEHSARVIAARPWSLLCVSPDFTPDPWPAHGCTVRNDGLASNWQGRVFLNPPYGYANLMKWVPKAVSEVEKGNAQLVCALLPNRTGSRWWQEYVLSEANALWDAYAHSCLLLARFLPGRVRFDIAGVPAENCAGFPSVVVVWAK